MSSPKVLYDLETVNIGFGHRRGYIVEIPPVSLSIDCYKARKSFDISRLQFVPHPIARRLYHSHIFFEIVYCKTPD